MARDADGTLVIEARLDTKQLNSDLKKMQKQLIDYEQDNKKLTEQKAKIEFDNEGLIQAVKRYEELEKEADNYRATVKKLRDLSENAPSVEARVAYFEEYKDEESKLEKITAEMAQQEKLFMRASEKLDQNNYKLKEINKKIKENQLGYAEVKQKVGEVNEQLGRTETLQGIKKALEGTGKELEKNIKKVARWGLAIFGIRSAYSGIRRIISMVTSQNEELANQIQQMKSVLIAVFVPVVQNIINWAAKAMVYINYLFKALTGRDLFNFADATKQASKNLASGAGSAKEIRKQLAGFDEMNILQDQSAGGAGGAGAADFENIFDKLAGMAIPKWIENLADILKKIKKYWKEVVTVVVAFAAAIKAMQIAKFVSSLLGIEKLAPKISAGIGLITAGIVLLAGNIINLILNWDEMTTKEKVLSGALAALGAAFIALGTAMALGFSIGTLGIGAVIAAIVAVTAVVGTLAYKHDEVARAAKDERTQEELLQETHQAVKDSYDELIDAVDRQAQAQENLIKLQEETQISGKELWESVENGTLTYQEMDKTQREVYKAYKDNLEATKQMNDATTKHEEAVKKDIAQDFNDRISKAKTRKEYEKLRDEIINAAEDGTIEWEDASDSISRMMGDMSTESRETFTKDIPENIKDGLEPSKYASNTHNFIDWWNNSFLGKLSRTIGIGVKVDYVDNGGAGKGFAKGGIVVPKLASGGIINQPGRGVPIASAIGGENGMEGVIPLTDSQQMELLGSAIGRYITINANITNTMNGRVISRELKRVQTEDDFASNN